jgi:ABC-type branched-subunit amino acid transport system substrate-binding protein
VDFRPLLRRLDGFRDLYIISYVEDASLLLKQARELAQGGAPEHSFFGTSVLDTEKLREQAGLAAEGLTFAVVGPSRSQDLSRRNGFASRYRAARSSNDLSRALESAAQEPTFAGYHVYDAVSLAGSGCLANPTKEAGRDEFVRYLRGVRDFAGLTGLIRFDPNGDLDADRTVVFKRFGNQGIETLATQ